MTGFQIVQTVLGVSSLLSTIVLGFLFRSLNNSQRKIERTEEERNASVKAAEARMEAAARKTHEVTDKLLDERFRSLSHEVRESVNGMISTVGEIKDRFKDVDGVAIELRDRDQKNELTLFGKIDSLKDFIRENAASKRDLEKHENNVSGRFERFEDQIRELGKALAVVSGNNPRRGS